MFMIICWTLSLLQTDDDPRTTLPVPSVEEERVDTGPSAKEERVGTGPSVKEERVDTGTSSKKMVLLTTGGILLTTGGTHVATAGKRLAGSQT